MIDDTRNKKKLTANAIEEAKGLNIPKRERIMFRKEDADWKAAFEWYNKHIHIGLHPLSMYCAPCYFKVINSLLEAQA